MNVLGHLDISGNLSGAFKEYDDFPKNPKVGTFALIHKRFMMCISLEEGSPFWIPLTQEQNTYNHIQPVAAKEWIISHNLGAARPIVQVYDGTGDVVNPSSIESLDINTTKVTFSDELDGEAVLMHGLQDGAPKPAYSFQIEFTDTDTIVVNHGLGYEPIVQVVVGHAEVQPSSVVHPNVNTTQIVLSAPTSGKVRCI